MTRSSAAATAAFVSNAVVPLVQAFRVLQDTKGRIVGDISVAQELLNCLREPVRTAYAMAGTSPACADAFEADLDLWLDRGLESIPQFDNTVAAYAPPANHAPTFFIAPLIATNGPAPRGSFLECLVAYREEPADLDLVSLRMPHPKNRCQSSRFLMGSSGLSRGNCIVFFPENVATAEKVESQTFALFFFNKFQRIYLAETMPRVRQVFGDRDWASARLSPTDCYRARCIWGYLHDYFHHCGPRPLDTNLQVKMKFFVGLLEETKVDCQAAVAAHRGDVPFGREIVEFIIFERMLRYPGQPDATTNFDAGTGFLLFEWLLQNACGLHRIQNGLDIDIDECVEGMSMLANAIETIEDATEEAEYRSRAKKFVRSLLPEGVDGARFGVPENYAGLVNVGIANAPILNFSNLPY